MLKSKRLQLGVLLWVAAMAGVVVLSLTVLPQLLEKAPSRVPVHVAIAISMLQSAALVALAVWAGVVLARPLGLSAPVAESALAGTGVWTALKPQLFPAAVVGLLVGGLLVVLASRAPEELRALSPAYEFPLAAKLLYGGVTEEILMRWGVMTAFIWLLWRVLQKRVGPPRGSLVVAGIVTAAVLFGAGHLPVAAAMGVELSGPVTAYIIAGNALPGILFGWLYWQRGLEAAIVAHALAHATATLAAFT